MITGLDRAAGGTLSKRALITGITGQDGTYFAELLLKKGYIVHGVNAALIVQYRPHRHFYQDPHEAEVRLYLQYRRHDGYQQSGARHPGVQPDEIYNWPRKATSRSRSRRLNIRRTRTPRDPAGARSDPESRPRKQNPVLSGLPSDFTAKCGRLPRAKHPVLSALPLGAAKLYAYWITVNYREAYGLCLQRNPVQSRVAVTGRNFVSRKITRALTRIAWTSGHPALGNLDSRRDWGHARDYVRAQWLMLQQEQPEDFVIATGQAIFGARLRRRGRLAPGHEDRVAGRGSR